MKAVLMIAAAAALAATGACRSSAAPSSYANPVEACESKPTAEQRDACMQDIVADVALSVKRESERKPPR
jgi:hypothetical protein